MKEPSEEHAKELAKGLALATTEPFHAYLKWMVEGEVWKEGAAKADFHADNIKAAIEESLKAYIEKLSCEDAKYMLLHFVVDQGSKACVQTTLDSIHKMQAKDKEHEGGFAV